MVSTGTGRFSQARSRPLNLDAVETLAGAVFLDDDQRDGLDDLIRGKALAALRAFTAATDAFSFVGGAGIDNFAVFTTAVGAFHMCSPSKTIEKYKIMRIQNL